MNEKFGWDITWLVHNQVILLHMWGDFKQARPQTAKDLDLEVTSYFEQSISESIHVLSDFTDMKSFPSLSLVLELRGARSSKAGWFVAYPQSSLFFEKIMQFAARVTGFKLHYVESLEAAIDFLKENDPQLSDMSPYE
jgi:hypothetical protein